MSRNTWDKLMSKRNFELNLLTQQEYENRPAVSSGHKINYPYLYPNQIHYVINSLSPDSPYRIKIGGS